VNHFAQLVHTLSSDIPFYGMQALGLEPDEVPQDCIEDMAARYIADMRVVQPRGPYFIGGRCLGGYIAFEMALQLVDIGENVALLALLDPTGPPGMRRDLRYYVRRAGYYRRRKQLIRAVLRRARSTVSQIERLRVLRYLGSRYTRRIQRTYKAHLRAQETYAPGVYSDTITFFGSREEYAPDDSRPLWKTLTSGGFELHLVPGTHRTMSQAPHLQALVRELEDVIYEARQRSQAEAREQGRQP
jgi:thioesterase domain-containing protein